MKTNFSRLFRSIFASLAVLTAGCWLAPDAVAAPEIQILWNTTEIVDGDTTPSVADHTFFGTQTVGAGSISQTFTIKNISPQSTDFLFLTGTPLVSIGGGNSADFVVSVLPASLLTGGATTTFQVTWTPTFGGIHNATLAIPNNDSNENPYNFAIQATAQLKLSYEAGANGSISGTTPQIVYSGASGTAVTAVPATGYHLVEWSDGSTANPRTDTPVTQNLTVKAEFAINIYSLSYTAGAGGSLTGNTSQSIIHGNNGTTVTAVPATGYSFVNWSDGSTANPRTDTNVTDNLSVTANFAIDTYTLSYAAGANGTLTGSTSQTVNHGTDGTAVTAVPATGYHFVNWSDASTANPRTDTNVTANLSVTANFALNTYTLSYAAGANGTLTGSSSQTVNHGANGTAVTAVPATGYHFVNWSDASTANPRTDSNVTANLSVTANFVINTYSLSYAAGANGTLTGSSSQTVNHGANGTAVTAVPAANYSFANWSDGSTANPRTDTNLTANLSVTANFLPSHTLSYAAGANGTLTGSSSQTVITGTDGTAVTAVPAPGYHFVDWSDASTANPRTDTNVTGNLSVTANFDNTYTLNYTAGANGTLTGSSSQTVTQGTDGTAVTAVPAAAYRFTQWSDGSTANPRTDTNVMTDRSVTAYFVLEVLSFTSTSSAVTISDCNISASGALVIPGTINGLPVTRIGNDAFYNCPQLTSITIPTSVTSIGYWAFSSCDGLTSINIPAGVTIIEDYTFSFCESLASITLPAGLTSIGDSAFEYCFDLTSITIPTSVTSIGYRAFSSCDGLTSINIPAGVTTIEDYTFSFCESLTSITLPAGLTSIGDAAFEFCFDLTSINIPASVTSLGANAFRYCNALIQITVAGDAYAAGTNGTLRGPTALAGSPGATGAAVTAVPKANYSFVNWSDGSTANPRSDTDVTTDLSVTANFVVNAPVVTGISPTNGPIVGGTSVTISGTLLLNASSVTFGGIEATIVGNTATSLTVTSPAHATGVATVVVTTPGGSSGPGVFTYDSPLETWRQTWFGPAATNIGDAADSADPYETGVPNHLVFAFFGPSQDPATAQRSQLPQAITDGSFFTYQFIEPAGVSGVTYGAQWSATLENDWLPVPDTGTSPEHLFSVPMDTDKKFLRLFVE